MRRFTGTFMLVLITHLIVKGQVQRGKLLDDGYIISFNDTPSNFLDSHYEDLFNEEEFEQLKKQEYLSIKYGIDILTQKIVVVQVDTMHMKEFSKIFLSDNLIKKIEKIISSNIKIEWVANPSHHDNRVVYRFYSITLEPDRKYKRKKRRKN
ncbi:MAG: hypothetical protein ACFB0B_17475 [Thermonemataceae bacterium]